MKIFCDVLMKKKIIYNSANILWDVQYKLGIFSKSVLFCLKDVNYRKFGEHPYVYNVDG